ncbi:hypothetical protein WA026_013298 [Henosepilachna vigintioctopunctata]|uniref:Uncharacterized protein n=1 Tax=Henosepilachna vigintioctopunctata TaxID=420089 RepID=A0AAW1VFC9_9CUCU
MSIKDRLKTAYEIVALNGDTTWTDSANTFQESNKKLYSRETQLNNIRILNDRPRTVKDSIPNSKLASYADYEYNEARELCYTKCIRKTQFEYLSKQVAKDERDEPWLLSDVDNLFIWFICCRNRTNIDWGAFQPCDEHGLKLSDPMEDEEVNVISPLLDANGFEEKKLKMSIISDKVKVIWNTPKDNLQQRYMAFARDIDLNINKLTGLQNSSSPYEHNNDQLLDEDSESMNDFDHLKDLASSFKEQNAWIAKCQTKIEEEDPQIEEVCQEVAKVGPLSSKRLYSAVLQGLSTTEALKKNEPSITVPHDQDTTESIHSALSSYATCCTSSISTVTVMNSNTQDSAGYDECSTVNKLIVQQDVKIQKSTSIQTNLKIFPKIKTNEVSSPPKPVNVITKESPQNNQDANLSSLNPVNYPLLTQSSMSYVNNYNYQFNASHYSNTFQNNCGCANTFSHTSQVITNRNMQAFQRPNPFIPNQYQYAQPVLMLQQNRTSVYPLAQPVAPPYYFQPLQQTRVMQRWIVPQNYSRPNMNQQNFPNTIQQHFVPSSPATWMGSTQQQLTPTTSQYYPDIQRTKAKPKKSTQPQISILKSKGRKPQEEGSMSTETTDSEALRRSLCANSNSTGLEISAPNVVQHKKLSSSPTVKVKTDFEEVVTKTVNLLFEDESHVPVTSTLSEELEIQALEQYCNSTDNVYQELERQAAEQYDDLSENSKGPPTRDVIFGGLSCFFACSIDVNV